VSEVLEPLNYWSPVEYLFRYPEELEKIMKIEVDDDE